MYEITEKGKLELTKYKGVSDKDLRLARRTLMIPILQAIEQGYGRTGKDLVEETGLPLGIVSGSLGTLIKDEYVEVLKPGPGSTSVEWTTYRTYLYRRRTRHYPEKTKERIIRSDVLFRERYPEIYKGKMGALDPGYARKYYERNREKILAKRKEEYPARRASHQSYCRKYYQLHKDEILEQKRLKRLGKGSPK
jgi:hypothetical protein